jgi:hypothetical protein
VREANGVHIMVRLLSRDNVKLLTILTDCLRILAMKNQPTKMIILEGNGPNLLVNIMKHQDYKNLIVMTARLLKGKANIRSAECKLMSHTFLKTVAIPCWQFLNRFLCLLGKQVSNVRNLVSNVSKFQELWHNA